MEQSRFERFKDYYVLLSNQIGGLALLAVIGLGSSHFVDLEIVGPSEGDTRVHNGK